MKRLLVLCANGWDREALLRPEIRRDHELVFAGEEIVAGVPLWRAMTFDVEKWLATTAAEHRDVDGVIGTGDYPGCLLAAELADRLGLPSAGAQPVVLLSHKLYSREIQHRAVPDATPAFAALDPLADDEPEGLRYPYFLKPVKGTMSIRAESCARPRSDGGSSTSTGESGSPSGCCSARSSSSSIATPTVECPPTSSSPRRRSAASR